MWYSWYTQTRMYAWTHGCMGDPGVRSVRAPVFPTVAIWYLAFGMGNT
jgi:hypothetical protein